MLDEIAARVRDNIKHVIVGKDDVIDLMMIAVLSEGHVLLEDVPGTGKTTLAKAMAISLGCTFRRIQFTPDLLPSDVTGVSFFNQKTQAFEFRPGPVLSQVVLADEINRATPRTQSAMLEGMQERQMTIDGETHPLPRPFLVMATQNPIELEGTFPLPEAQLDRFLLRVSLGYPDKEQENAILRRFRTDDPLDHLEPVTDPTSILEQIRRVRDVHVAEPVQDYLVTIARRTRSYEEIDLGASPRATLALYRTAQARAAVAGRDFVLPDDVKYLAPYVLTHRVQISPQTRLRGRRAEDVISDLVSTIPVPVEH
jgi:MoxR-like ATPase